MTGEDSRRRSHWMMRALEWDEPRARYPNIWHGGMPRHIMAFDTVACRLRLGDFIAVYHPTSKRRPERSNRFLGISRVVGLRQADEAGFGWIDLETEHRFEPPLEIERRPRRVFMCCDAGWPETDVSLFRQVHDAAVAAGWSPPPAEPVSPARHEGRPGRDEGEGGTVATERRTPTRADDDESTGSGTEHRAPRTSARVAAFRVVPTPGAVVFGGVDYSGDMRDPRDATWLALAEHRGEALHVIRLEATGRHGLQAHLRDPDAVLMRAEAIGLDFPFGLPLRFAERILGGPFPDEGWWALVKRFERLSRPDYLVAVQEFRDAEGEPKRLTDERAGAFSPLHRVNPDLGPMTFHGIRMIGEERSRYAVKPFENAQGKLLLEVYPGALTRRLALDTGNGKTSRRAAILEALAGLDHLPVVIEEPWRQCCLVSRDALDAVIAARCAAAALLSGETEKGPDALTPEDTARVRLEGWIYGLEP